MERWKFLTNHARVLLCLAREPGVRLREVAAGLGITERSAQTIVADLAAAGYVVKHKHGRRNRYQIRAHLPLPELARPESAISDVLALLMGGREAEGSDGAVCSQTPKTATGTAAGTTTATGTPPAQPLSPEESPHDANRAPRA